MQKAAYKQDFYKTLGQTLKTKRKERGLTQGEISDLLGLERSLYCRYEGGKTCIPLYDLYCLSKFYKTTIEMLLGV